MRIFVTISIVVLSICSWAKPIAYDVSKLIGSATFVGEVVITKYDSTEGVMRFKSLEFQDTINQAFCSNFIGYTFNYENSESWTSYFPNVGDTVLIVVEGGEHAAVFGKQIGEFYRLWSTLYSGSIAIFNFEAPLLPISKEDIMWNNDSSTACWDGCLFPVSQLRSLVDQYQADFNRMLSKVDLTSLEDKEVYTIFYSDTLKYYEGHIWSDEPPGKLRSVTFTYANGRSLKVIPHTPDNKPVQFDINRKFDIETFKMLKIKSIRWVE